MVLRSFEVRYRRAAAGMRGYLAATSIQINCNDPTGTSPSKDERRPALTSLQELLAYKIEGYDWWPAQMLGPNPDRRNALAIRSAFANRTRTCPERHLSCRQPCF